MADEVLHGGVGEGQRARIENDAGRVGVIKADDQGLFSGQHAAGNGEKRKVARLGMRKAKGPLFCLFLSPLASVRALRHDYTDPCRLRLHSIVFRDVLCGADSCGAILRG